MTTLNEMVTEGEVAPRRERLRFVGFEFDQLPNSRCQARVALEWHPGARFEGESEGFGSDAGALRCAAEATLTAIEHAVDGSISVELLGVKSVRAFDTVVLIVSVLCRRGDKSYRVVGSFLAKTDLTRGAAVAVLNATNRLLGNIFGRETR